MICELNDLKFCLKVMDGPDYQPLVENNKEIERLQEELSLVGTQLITERQNKEMIMKEINGIIMHKCLVTVMIIETREKLSQCPSSVTEQEHSQVVINKHSTSTDTSKASPEEHEGERPKEQAPSRNTTLEQEVESPVHTFGAPIDLATVYDEVITIVCAYIDVLYRCITVASHVCIMHFISSQASFKKH